MLFPADGLLSGRDDGRSCETKALLEVIHSAHFAELVLHAYHFHRHRMALGQRCSHSAAQTAHHIVVFGGDKSAALLSI